MSTGGTSENIGRVNVCPLCHGRTFEHRLHTKGVSIEACATCGLVLQNPQPGDLELAEIYGPNYFIGSSHADPLAGQFEIVKRATARLQLKEIDDCLTRLGRSRRGARLLEIGCGHGNMLLEAQACGYEVSGLEFSQDAAARANSRLGHEAVKIGQLDDGVFARNSFDVCILADVIEHVRDPRRFLSLVFEMLSAGGVVFIATPSLDSWSAKLMGRFWVEYKREHLFYFNRETIAKLLTTVGFRDVKISSGLKVLTPQYIFGHFRKFPVPGCSFVFDFASSVLPKRILEMKMVMTASGVNVIGCKGDASAGTGPLEA